MNLEEFVRETLEQIAKGVSGAGLVAREHGACINPNDIRWHDEHPRLYRSSEGGGGLVEEVGFDVALTVSEEKQVEGKAGLVIASIGAGVKGQSVAATSSVSRVKFSVPVQLPLSS